MENLHACSISAGENGILRLIPLLESEWLCMQGMRDAGLFLQGLLQK